MTSHPAPPQADTTMHRTLSPLQPPTRWSLTGDATGGYAPHEAPVLLDKHSNINPQAQEPR